MKTKQLGDTKLRVSEMGFGCMHSADEKEAIATLHHALDLGVNFYDTADVSDLSANEELLAKAFKNQWNKIIIATQFGLAKEEGLDDVKTACDASLKRLGVDVIDLYYFRHADQVNALPIEETIGVMADLITTGKVRYIGLSAVDADTLQKAHNVYPITALQSHRCTPEMISLCERLRISFVVSNLEKIFLAPHFIAKINKLTTTKTCTITQLALAWMLAKSATIVPMPSTKQRQLLEENIHATQVTLDENDIATLNEIFQT